MEKLSLRPIEAAKMLSISPRTLWQWTVDGKIPCVRIGDGERKTYLYPVDVLKTWLANSSKVGG